jgi:hypothetical protein
VAAILVAGLKCQTQFWKGTTQKSSQQSLVEIGSVVSEEKIFLARKCPNLNCISMMMSFSACVTGFFMNFELLPILTDYAN